MAREAGGFLPRPTFCALRWFASRSMFGVRNTHASGFLCTTGTMQGCPQGGSITFVCLCDHVQRHVSLARMSPKFAVQWRQSYKRKHAPMPRARVNSSSESEDLVETRISGVQRLPTSANRRSDCAACSPPPNLVIVSEQPSHMEEARGRARKRERERLRTLTAV